MTIKSTCLLSRHVKLGAKMVVFSGWNMPVQYRGILPEHEHTRRRASVFDTCHMGEFLLQGKGVGAFLDILLTSMPSRLKDGRCRYGLMLNDAGNVVDDVISYRIHEEKYLLVVNAGTVQTDLEHIKALLPSSIELQDLSEKTGKIDLQGPMAFDVLEKVLGNFRDLTYFSFKESGDVIVSRTGYTGEMGVELYGSFEGIQGLWDALCEDERVEPAGLGARDTLRLEVGLSLYGHELDLSHSPLESGVERFVLWETDFIGRAAIEKQRREDRQGCLKAFVVEGRSAPRAGDEVLCRGEKIGTVTSGSLAPSLGHAIALARLLPGHEDATDLSVVKGQRHLPLIPTDLPFYKLGTARKKL